MLRLYRVFIHSYRFSSHILITTINTTPKCHSFSINAIFAGAGELALMRLHKMIRLHLLILHILFELSECSGGGEPKDTDIFHCNAATWVQCLCFCCWCWCWYCCYVYCCHWCCYSILFVLEQSSQENHYKTLVDFGGVWSGVNSWFLHTCVCFRLCIHLYSTCLHFAGSLHSFTDFHSSRPARTSS